MAFELIKIVSSNNLIRQYAVAEILRTNELSAPFGLVLTPAQAEDIVDTRLAALRDRGRIEFGRGITERLIESFYDSRYLNKDNYAESLNGLHEIFYYLRAESYDMYNMEGLISDDDIIAGMKKAFETICQGSIELLAGREGAKIVRSFISDYEPDFNEDHNHEGGYLDDWADEWEQ